MNTSENNKATLSSEQPMKLTDKQGEVLEFIDSEIKKDPYGKSPKLRWIASSLGMRTSNAWEYATQLRANGCLNGEADRRRSLSITEIGRATLEKAEQVRQELLAASEAAADAAEKKEWDEARAAMPKKKKMKKTKKKKKKSKSVRN